MFLVSNVYACALQFARMCIVEQLRDMQLDEVCPVFEDVCMYVCMYVCIYVRVCVCVCVRMYAQTCLYVHTRRACA
jgi:hypothetical protein